jgi:eukaryotic-like serine/threonine-protein kinase
MTPAIDKLLFTAASGFVDRDERLRFLKYACRGDDSQLKRLEELFEIQNDADEFFDLRPAVSQPASAAEEAMEEGGVGARIGPYRLIDRLGAGGCGVVYLAEQQIPVKRKVALKIIRLGMDTENVIARFAIEREALAMMDHPNIARVLDAGTTASGRPYFAMELVEGEKITEFCDNNRLGLRQRLELFILVCEAIQHAHQKGVVHRDIKPSNILVRKQDDRLEPKVIDFGIAKATASELSADATVTKCGQFIGTPAYMSPEQADGSKDIDTRSDIYSLGALLCELLTGSPPFRAEHFNDRNPDEIRHILREGETGMPSAKLRIVPKDEIGTIAGNRDADPHRLPGLLAGDLDWIVMKAIEKDRQRRYGTAAALAMDVQCYLREQPVLARPPSRMYQFGKLVRRNRIIFTAASIALFGLLGGFGVSTWLLVRERDARREQARLRVVAEQARAVEVRLREDANALEMMARAAVSLRHKEMDQADLLMTGLTIDRVPRTLEAANTLMALANWNLSGLRWRQAASRFNLLAHVLTSVDMKDTDQISHELLPTLTAVCTWGEAGEYETLRSLTIDRFSDSSNPSVAEQVIKATLLKPADSATMDRMRNWPPVIEASIGKGDANSHLVAWRQFSLALMSFRRGELDIAHDWAHRSLATATNSQTRMISNQIILAMVDSKKGNFAEARKTLEDVRKQVSQWEQAPFQVTTPDGTLWSNWGIAKILLTEAERMTGEVAD